jgi:hypothetical protein
MYNIVSNQNAFHLFEENQDKINWWSLSENPSIFEIDEKQI